MAWKPGHSAGSTGSTRSPVSSGRMPRIHWVMATKFHAAVPVSQEFFASPWVGGVPAGDHLRVDVRLAAGAPR